MNLQKITRLVFIAILLLTNNSYAQDLSKPGNPINDQNVNQAVTTMLPAESDFMMVGLVTFGWINQKQTFGGVSTKQNSIGDADRYEFSPMFLWRHGDKLLAEFEPSWNGYQLGVNWADVAYFVKPGLIIKGGYLVLPFGTYTKRLAAGWINKLTSDPMGVDMAGSDFGIEVEGGLPLGNMKWSYDVSLTNGYQLNNDGTIGNLGIGLNPGITNNDGKTFCGRLALLPLSNSSLELGFSYLYGSMAKPAGASFTNINATDTKGPSVSMMAADLNFVHNVNPVQINIKAQYSATMVSDEKYFDSTALAQYTFTNTTSTLFGQLSLRPSKSNNKILKNLELAMRYVDYTAPKNSGFGQSYNEMDVCLDYWLSWRTVLKLGYENIKSDGYSFGASTGSATTNNLIIQFSTEF